MPALLGTEDDTGAVAARNRRDGLLGAFRAVRRACAHEDGFDGGPVDHDDLADRDVPRRH